MKVQVPLDNGYINSKYAKGAKQTINGKPSMSFPIMISGVPDNAKTLAFCVIDWDSIPVCGLPWIHWVGANIDPMTTLIPGNASQNESVKMTHGKNTLAGAAFGPLDPKISQHYTGPVPPDKPHDYTLYMFALDKKLPLKDGFWLNQMFHAMKGHILAKAKFVVPADRKSVV